MNNKGIIFLLENSTDYLFLLDQGFREGKICNPLRVARYGNEAILYLKGVGIYADRKHYPLPQLIMIDSAICDGSALAVLGWVRRQADLNEVPIIILQHAEQSRALKETFDKNNNAHCMQRDDIAGLVQMIKTLDLVKNHAVVPADVTSDRVNPVLSFV